MELDSMIQIQFRGETKPSKHQFRPSGQIRRTSWQLTQVESVSLRVSNCGSKKSHFRTPYHASDFKHGYT